MSKHMVAQSEAWGESGDKQRKDQKERDPGGRPTAGRTARAWHPWPTSPTSLNPVRGLLPGPDIGGFRQCPKHTLELYT